MKLICLHENELFYCGKTVDENVINLITLLWFQTKSLLNEENENEWDFCHSVNVVASDDEENLPTPRILTVEILINLHFLLHSLAKADEKVY